MRYGGVEIEKVSLLGTQLSFKNIEALYLGVWLLFIYFLWRYYQYYKKEGEANFWGEINQYINNESFSYIKSQANKQHPNIKHDGSDYFYNNLESYSILKFKGQITKLRPVEGTVDQTEYYIDKYLLTPFYIRSFLNTVFNTTQFTDYLLPFALSIFTVIYCSSGDWQGSLINTISAIFT